MSQRTLATAACYFIDGVELLFYLSKAGMETIDVDPRVILIFLHDLFAPAMMGPGAELRVDSG